MTKKDLMNLGTESRMLINKYLEKNNVSINALAVKAGVHPTQLYLYLNNQRGLTDSSLEKIGRVLCD
jgi:plasmid maintenance system antidote protein VapI